MNIYRFSDWLDKISESIFEHYKLCSNYDKIATERRFIRLTLRGLVARELFRFSDSELRNELIVHINIGYITSNLLISQKDEFVEKARKLKEWKNITNLLPELKV